MIECRLALNVFGSARTARSEVLSCISVDIVWSFRGLLNSGTRYMKLPYSLDQYIQPKVPLKRHHSALEEYLTQLNSLACSCYKV